MSKADSTQTSYSIKVILAFWKRVQKGSMEECWEWLGYKNRDGYGQAGQGGVKQILAHRFSWILKYGPIPEGKYVLHDCPNGDNPACVNPAHLWLGTQADNIKDMVKKGRCNPATCEKQRSAKLTKEKVIEIRRRHSAGESMSSLTKEFPVSLSQIGRIVRYVYWNF